MYRNFKLTDEERKAILEQHSAHGYKTPLSESATPPNVSCLKGFKFIKGKPYLMAEEGSEDGSPDTYVGKYFEHDVVLYLDGKAKITNNPLLKNEIYHWSCNNGKLVIQKLAAPNPAL